jgi:hypothetical protein
MIPLHQDKDIEATRDEVCIPSVLVVVGLDVCLVIERIERMWHFLELN